jgi:GTP-binding protein
MAPFDDSVDPVTQARAIIRELGKYDDALASADDASADNGHGEGLPPARQGWQRASEKLHDKPRWLVLNKLDMVPAEERRARVKDFVRRLRWKGPVFEISALAREGLQPLVQAVWQHVAKDMQALPTEVDPRFDVTAAPLPVDAPAGDDPRFRTAR